MIDVKLYGVISLAIFYRLLAQNVSHKAVTLRHTVYARVTAGGGGR